MIKSLFKCMYSHRLLVVGMILAPKSRCSVPGSFEDETLLICIIYIQEKVHQSIPNADTGLPWCTWCWNSSLVYSFNIKLQVSGSSWWGGVVWTYPYSKIFHQLGNMKYLSQRRSFIPKAGTALLILLVPRQSWASSPFWNASNVTL